MQTHQEEQQNQDYPRRPRQKTGKIYLFGGKLVVPTTGEHIRDQYGKQEKVLPRMQHTSEQQIFKSQEFNDYDEEQFLKDLVSKRRSLSHYRTNSIISQLKTQHSTPEKHQTNRSSILNSTVMTIEKKERQEFLELEKKPSCCISVCRIF